MDLLTLTWIIDFLNVSLYRKVDENQRTINELKEKHNTAIREKMLVKLKYNKATSLVRFFLCDVWPKHAQMGLKFSFGLVLVFLWSTRCTVWFTWNKFPGLEFISFEIFTQPKTRFIYNFFCRGVCWTTLIQYILFIFHLKAVVFHVCYRTVRHHNWIWNALSWFMFYLFMKLSSLFSIPYSVHLYLRLDGDSLLFGFNWS